MSPTDDLRRLGRRLGAVREAVTRGDGLDRERFRDLVLEVDAQVRASARGAHDQAPADRRQLLALLDEASALRDLLERAHDSTRQAIDLDTRRRLGRAAYRRPSPG